MKNQIFKSVLSLVLSATLLLGGVSPALAAETSKPEINVSEETKTISKNDADNLSTKLTLGKTTTDYLETKDSEEWYKFTTTQRGYFRLNFKINDYSDQTTVNSGWNVEIFNSKDLNNPIKGYKGIKSERLFPILPMQAGDYYIKVSVFNRSNNGQYAPVGCKYDLNVGFTASSVWELEGNNDTSAIANTIIANTAYYGTLYYNNDVDWYKVGVSSNGYMNLTLGVPSSTNRDEINSGWNVTIYDAEGNELKTVKNIKNAYTFPALSAPKGSYYIRVSAYNASNSGQYAPVDCTYSLNLNHKASSVWETEYNNSNATADTMKLATDYYGSLYYNSDVDWYKVATTKNGYFKVSLNLDSSVDVDSVNSGWNISIMDGQLNEIVTYSKITRNWTSDILPYPKGTYYVKVSAYNSSNNGQYAPVDCTYKLKVTNTESSTWESEDNNARNKSDKISLNKTYKGMLINSSDQDWYKVSVSAAGKIKLNLKKDSSVNIDDVGNGWNVYVYKTDSTNPVCKLERVTTTSSVEATVGKGTYYIKVIPNYAYSGCPTRLTYNLSVKYAQTPAKVTITKATPAKKQVTLKWKQSKKADGYYIYRSTSKKGTYTKVATIKKGSTVKYTDKKLKAKKTYYYKVVAYNTDNGVTATASASAIVNKKTK